MTETSTRNLLSRVLEEASLVARVRELDARTLGGLINRVGLEDAGEIVALATTEQLTEVFDEDLWAADEPGEQERFDPERFALWLEILLESGEKFVADKLTELSEDFVTLALQRQVLVINIDELAVEMSERHRDVDLVEKALESCLYEEIAEYRIIARRHDGWDAIVTVLLALDQDHHDYLDRLLSRCCYASSEYIEDNGGLYEVLSADEMLESDAAADRDDRRAHGGYVAATDAASFLGLPRVTTLDEILSCEDRDPVTRAYFRSVNRRPEKSKKAPSTREERAEQERFAYLLQEAGVVETSAPPLLEGAPEDPASRFQATVGILRMQDPAVYARRMEELAYLANVLVAGSSFARRAFRPVEAAEAAIAICNLGLEHCLSALEEPPLEVVKRDTADRLFRIGWHITFWHVSMAVAQRLEKMLGERAAGDKRVPMVAIRTVIRDHRPWQMLTKLDSIAGYVPEKVFRCLPFLLDRCPTLPPGHGRKAKSETFIATSGDVELARRLAG